MTRRGLIIGGIALASVAVAAGFGLGRIGSKPMTPSAVAPTGKGAVLYWYDPMVPSQHFDKPGKSPFMDMQLLPKYAGGADVPGVIIDAAKLQNLGVRYATATRGQIGQSITASAVIDFNQRDLAVVQARTGGFVQRVYNRAPGDTIAAGAPLADLLVPEWAGAQTEFLAVRNTGNTPLIEAARQRLSLLGMSAASIAELERTGRSQAISTITSPIAGVIRTLDVRSGMTLGAGQALAQINGLGTVWVNANVPAEMAGALRAGQTAQVMAAGDNRPLSGRITAILPEISGDTRTLQVRVELGNPGGRLRPGGFATVSFTGASHPALLVPSEAVIRTGQRALVMLALRNGAFQPAQVQLGAESSDQTEILSGLSEGERIVASGQFLIDSEASLSGVPARTSPAVIASPAAQTAYESTGRIERLDASGITISHQPVPAIQWPAMTMTFILPSPAIGQGLKVGDRVRFAFTRPDKGPTIARLTKDAGQ